MIMYALSLILIILVDFQMPLEGSTQALLLVVAGYVGVDQLASIVTTTKLPKGLKYTGSYKKLLKILIAMFVITGEAIIIQGLAKEVELPLDQLVFTTGLIASLFVGGNKGNTAAEKIGDKE